MNHFHEILGIGPSLSINLDFSEELQGDVKVENGAHADGAEEAHVQRLTLLVDLRDVVVHGEDDGWATEKKDQDSEEDQAVYRNDGVMGEFGPRTYSTYNETLAMD